MDGVPQLLSLEAINQCNSYIKTIMQISMILVYTVVAE